MTQILITGITSFVQNTRRSSTYLLKLDYNINYVLSGSIPTFTWTVNMYAAANPSTTSTRDWLISGYSTAATNPGMAYQAGVSFYYPCPEYWN